LNVDLRNLRTKRDRIIFLEWAVANPAAVKIAAQDFEAKLRDMAARGSEPVPAADMSLAEILAILKYREPPAPHNPDELWRAFVDRLEAMPADSPIRCAVERAAGNEVLRGC